MGSHSLLKMFSIALICSILGCIDESTWKGKLPKDSTNVKVIDLYHCEFDWRGKHYLYGWDGHAQFMIEIGKPDASN